MSDQVTPSDPSASTESGELVGEARRSRAIRGSAITVIGYGASQVIRLGTNIVLAALLFPEAFGIMALVWVFQQGLAMFSDIGIGTGIIYSKYGDDPRYLNTAWTTQVLRGVLLTVISLAGAIPYAAFYDRPDLLWLVPVTGLTALIEGFSSTKYYTQTRRLLLGRRTFIEVASVSCGCSVMMLWAAYEGLGTCWVEQSLWPLAIGGLFTSFSRMAMTHLVLPGERNRFAWDRTYIREIWDFGKWVFASTALTFFALQIDRLMLGKLVTDQQLGIYTISQALAALPPTLCSALANAVIYPILSSSERLSREEFVRSLLRSREIVLPVALFALLGVAFCSPVFFRWLYDDRYLDAGHTAQWLTIPMWLLVLVNSTERAPQALGQTKVLAKSMAASLSFKVVGSLIGFEVGGLQGFILGLALGELARQLVLLYSLNRAGASLYAQDLSFTLLGLGLGLFGVFAPRIVCGLLGAEPAIPIVELVVAVVILVPLGWKVATGLRRELARRAGG